MVPSLEELPFDLRQQRQGVVRSDEDHAVAAGAAVPVVAAWLRRCGAGCCVRVVHAGIFGYLSPEVCQRHAGLTGQQRHETCSHIVGVQIEHRPGSAGDRLGSHAIVDEHLFAAVAEVLGDAATPEAGDAATPEAVDVWTAVYWDMAAARLKAESDLYARFEVSPGDV